VNRHRALLDLAATLGGAAVAMGVAAVVAGSGGLGVGAVVLAVLAWRGFDYVGDDRDIAETKDGRLVARPSTAWLFDRARRRKPR